MHFNLRCLFYRFQLKSNEFNFTDGVLNNDGDVFRVVRSVLPQHDMSAL